LLLGVDNHATAPSSFFSARIITTIRAVSMITLVIKTAAPMPRLHE
jgi:hypothetical protein